jgi:hypothetical protein
MKSFLIKVFYFSTTLLAICSSVTIFLPKELYWGNKEYSQKLNLYRKGTYNSAFFGSSRILTGIDPYLFDSLMNQRYNNSIQSFNLATPGTWANETFYLYQHFLEDPTLSNNINIVFMEFQNIMAIRPDKLTTNKAIYYQSLLNTLFTYNYSLHEIGLSFKNLPSSLYIAGSYSLASIQKLLNFNRLNVNETQVDSLAYYGINSRGYLGLHERKVTRKEISTKELEVYKQSIQTHLTKSQKSYNEIFYKKYMETIRQSKNKGIRVIFVLPPVKLTAGMAAVYNALPQENKIDVCDPIKFPELYKEENWIDDTHLSVGGGVHLVKNIVTELSLTKEITNDY